MFRPVEVPGVLSPLLLLLLLYWLSSPQSGGLNPPRGGRDRTRHCMETWGLTPYCWLCSPCGSVSRGGSPGAPVAHLHTGTECPGGTCGQGHQLQLACINSMWCKVALDYGLWWFTVQKMACLTLFNIFINNWLELMFITLKRLMALFHYTFPARLASTRLDSVLFAFPLGNSTWIVVFRYYSGTI